MRNRFIALALVAAIAALVVSLVVCGGKEEPKPTSIHAEIQVAHRGSIWCMLYRDVSPTYVDKFVKLAKEGFYDGLLFWHVSDMGLVQSGCPNNDGTGWYTDPTSGRLVAMNKVISPDSLKHVEGTLSMINTTKPGVTPFSQFLICTEAVPDLDGKHTIIGEVVEGMTVLDSIEKNDTITTIVIQERFD